ncbi:hypothetical protein T265_04877 [Opisthorchis viverrini]|uniref:Nanos-type domain-containing protein n=1 Tax=Opisthorchis viverrini TaxID=6198 RepID=A0A075AG13_OPIVI|nr:hypothetical protein T265_04877 [Opisthorchis viverrini]KER28279.1 hypothetical protein T265_04877 [Opisthorchis viverrini]
MEASANRLSTIWERTATDPLDIPKVPNGLWMDNNSPWSSPSGSPKFSFCSTVCVRDCHLTYVQGMNTSKDFASRSCSYPSPMSSALPTGSMKYQVQPPPSKVKPEYAKSLQKGSLDNWCTLEKELEAWEKRACSGRATIPRSQLIAFGDLVRRLRATVRRKCEEGLDLCAFCRNNGEHFNVYITHKVRDASGRVTCPVLRLLSCPLCKSTGDAAHTIKYCPLNRKESHLRSVVRSTPESPALPSWRTSDPMDISTVPGSSSCTVESSWSPLSCSLGSTSTSSLSAEWDGSSVATLLARLSISPTNHTAVTNVYDSLSADCGLMHGLGKTTGGSSPERRLFVERPTGRPEPISRKPTQQKSLTKWTELDNELELWERHLSVLGCGGRRISQSQLAGLSNFVRRLRVAVRHKKEEGIDLCAFCRNNGEPFEIYVTHKVKDSTGRVLCPVLRLLSCPLCKSTGDLAHTIKYCPYRFMEHC